MLVLFVKALNREIKSYPIIYRGTIPLDNFINLHLGTIAPKVFDYNEDICFIADGEIEGENDDQPLFKIYLDPESNSFMYVRGEFIVAKKTTTDSELASFKDLNEINEMLKDITLAVI